MIKHYERTLGTLYYTSDSLITRPKIITLVSESQWPEGRGWVRTEAGAADVFRHKQKEGDSKRKSTGKDTQWMCNTCFPKSCQWREREKMTKEGLALMRRPMTTPLPCFRCAKTYALIRLKNDLTFLKSANTCEFQPILCIMWAAAQPIVNFTGLKMWHHLSCTHSESTVQLTVLGKT